jgi:hypothetical protein
MGLSDRLGYQSLLASPAGLRDDQATLAILAILDHQAPALAPSRRIPRLELASIGGAPSSDKRPKLVHFERGKLQIVDQHFAERLGACSEGSLSQRPIVSYL